MEITAKNIHVDYLHDIYLENYKSDIIIKNNIFDYKEEQFKTDLFSDIMHCIIISLSNEKIEMNDDKNIELSISFVTSSEIKNLNMEYRGKDSETDVLSFPQFRDIQEINMSFSSKVDEIFLGDIVISLEKIKEQSNELGHHFNKELLYLIIHSVLHLLGYDHLDEKDKTVMRNKEKKIMSFFEVQNDRK